MKALYSITKGALVLDNGTFILTYGIEATDKENGSPLSKFADVSVNRNTAERIVSLLNSCEIELCHFYDVVIDELNR
jgi:hypothetical protein